MIRLKEITSKNIWRIIELKVSQEQENFVATNTQSILEAYVNQNSGNVALPFGIYDDETLIGFVMIGFDSIDSDDPEIAKGNYLLWRYMIDVNFQGKGYGKRALSVILDFIMSWPIREAKSCWVSYEPDNIVARKLYTSMGFVETGEVSGDEVVAVRMF